MTTNTPSSRVAHQTRLVTGKIATKLSNPHGNYQHSQIQWGVVNAINGFAAVGPQGQPIPNTVNVYPAGSQNTSDTANLLYGVKYMSWYVPTIGDTVVMLRGFGRNRSSKIIIGKLYGSASPYPLPLGGLLSGRYVTGPNAIWGGAGAPNALIGITGDYYFRTDTPSTSGQRLYVKESGGWTATSL